MSQVKSQSPALDAVPIILSQSERETCAVDRPAVYHVGNYDEQAPNGVLKVIYSYCQLLRNELACHVVSFDLRAGDGYAKEQQGRLTIHHFECFRGKGFALPARLKPWLQSIPSDAIFHLHGVFNPSNYALARRLKRRGIRYIYTPHDSYSPASIRKNRLLKRLYIQLCEKPILKHAWRVHALSSEGHADISALTNTPILLVPNFVLPLPTMHSDGNEREHVSFVGRLDVFQKGLDLALYAYKRFCEMVSDPPPFLLVGPENDGSLPVLQSICKELKLEVGRDVHFVGQVDEQTKARLLRNSRVYLQLSRFEGFGLSIVEALSVGVPVVVSDQVPIADEIAALQGGRKVSSIEDAALALKQIWEMPAASYASLCSDACRCYQSKYSPAALRPIVVQLYQDHKAAATARIEQDSSD